MSYVLPALMRKAGGMAIQIAPKSCTCDLAAFGKAMKLVIAEKQLSQRKLAQRTSIDFRRVNAVAQGRGNPTYKTLKRLCDGLGVSLGELQVRAETLARQSRGESQASGDALKFNVVFEGAGDGWVHAHVPELPEVHTQAEGLNEARAVVREAIELVLDHRREHGQAIPAAGWVLVEPVEIPACRESAGGA
jgi:predicted RNase H-like HicB family nuclease/DNA-binding Xre family transcriptional regulator